MSAKLVMVGPGQLVIHKSVHDLESSFYVLLGILVLLDEPYKSKSNEELTQCFDKYFNTFELSVLKTITIQADLTWKSLILQHISTYFEPIIKLLTRLRDAIVSPLYMNHKANFSIEHHSVMTNLSFPSLIHSQNSTPTLGCLIDLTAMSW